MILILMRIWVFQIRNSARDALDFLRKRRDFWQQQKPVYARKIELEGNVTENFEMPVN